MIAIAAAVPAQANTRTFGLTSFDRIEIYGDMVVEIIPDNRITAVANASRASLETLSMEVSNRILTVRQVSEGVYGPRTTAADGPISIRITAQNLSAIVVRGSAQVTAAGLRGREILITTDGAARVTATIPSSEAVLLRSTGSGEITVSGRTQRLRATTNGAGAIDASALAARDLDVQVVGTGNSSFAASATATILAQGAAGATVTGRPRCEVRNTGAGTTSCGAAARGSAAPRGQ